MRLRFSVFVWTIVRALAFLSVCMDSCTCACVSHCLYELTFVFSQCLNERWCLRLRCSMRLNVLLCALAFLSVCHWALVLW